MAMDASKRLRWGRKSGRVTIVILSVFLAALVFAAILAPVVAPHSPTRTSLLDALLPPGSADHLLGTDSTGRDTLSRLVYGARLSLVAPLGVVILSVVTGTILGLVAARRGGWVDALISRSMDVVYAFPSLLLALLAVAIFGTGLKAPIIALAIAYAPFMGRIVRGVALQELARPYVGSYQVMGFGSMYVVIRRVLPNLMPLILTQSALAFGYSMIDLASLSYLGLGVQPPDADWGTMINQAQSAILQGEPWSAIVPGAVIVLTVIAVNVLGERLGARLSKRDAVEE
ncbi:ABC transporter permease [Phycicoccus sp. Soil803]|uniref:ABC transporter permease n=1 Tax=Phycicoccus sp. Soil803 TaxID=1736415 RepID=UPI0009E79657|nr:ABC transporter permease [Phycicoccus sp. Soil803]